MAWTERPLSSGWFIGKKKQWNYWDLDGLKYGGWYKEKLLSRSTQFLAPYRHWRHAQMAELQK